MLVITFSMSVEQNDPCASNLVHMSFSLTWQAKFLQVFFVNIGVSQKFIFHVFLFHITPFVEQKLPCGAKSQLKTKNFTTILYCILCSQSILFQVQSPPHDKELFLKISVSSWFTPFWRKNCFVVTHAVLTQI